MKKLMSGFFSKESCFTDYEVEELVAIAVCMEKEERRNDDDQCQLYRESSDERFPKCAWIRNFRIAHRDVVKEDLLMQENMSCISLHKNYPYSVEIFSKQMRIRCFFVVGKIYEIEFKIV